MTILKIVPKVEPRFRMEFSLKELISIRAVLQYGWSPCDAEIRGDVIEFLSETDNLTHPSLGPDVIS